MCPSSWTPKSVPGGNLYLHYGTLWTMQDVKISRNGKRLTRLVEEMSPTSQSLLLFYHNHLQKPHSTGTEYSQHGISGGKSPGQQQIDLNNRPRLVPVQQKFIVDQPSPLSASFELWQSIVCLHQVADSVVGAHPDARPLAERSTTPTKQVSYAWVPSTAQTSSQSALSGLRTVNYVLERIRTRNTQVPARAARPVAQGRMLPPLLATRSTRRVSTRPGGRMRTTRATLV
ncbi:hypothetical protein B0H14DRAFT_2561169 [Mycena olivaceomarginata]|nr:hypothetical protein B0H14DRAFT_2561169 [Mycena olivaceomarginata]